MIGFLRNLLHYAGLAWNAIAGLPGDVQGALRHLWNFTASVHTLLDHLVSSVFHDLTAAQISLMTWIVAGIGDIVDAIERIDSFILRRRINPLRLWLIDRIKGLRRWTDARLTGLWELTVRLYALSIAYTQHMVGIERQQRIADVKAARAYALKLVTAMHELIEKEAAQGYAAGSSQRLSVIQKLTDEIAQRNPVIRALVSDFVTLLVDAIGTENPLERAALQFLLKRVIDKLGVDRVAGDLLSRLAGPLIGDPHPKNLHDVVRDLAQRVSAVEEQWADFMVAGGPEVEQAGREWKSYTSLTADAAMIGFFAFAVADPGRWAADVSATAGAVVDGTIKGVTALIREG